MPLNCQNDALVKVLNEYGYNPILLPRSGLEPPEIYIYDIDRLRRWGRLASAVPPGTLPTQLYSGSASDITHKQTSRKGMSAAASFLEEALKVLGVGGAPRLDLSFTRNREVTFSFAGVTYLGLDPADIGAALRKGFDPGGLDRHDIDNGNVYIAYEYAYADSVDMTIADGVEAGIDLQAIKLEGFVDLGGKAEFAATSSTTLKFTKPGAKAVFASKVGVVQRNEQSQFTFDAVEVLRGPRFGPAEQSDGGPVLFRRGEIFAVDDLAVELRS